MLLHFFWYVFYCLPVEPEDGDTCLRGKMVSFQPHELKLAILMQFLHSRSYASVYRLNCNCVPQKLLMNVFSEVNPSISTLNDQADLKFHQI